MLIGLIGQRQNLIGVVSAEISIIHAFLGFYKIINPGDGEEKALQALVLSFLDCVLLNLGYIGLDWLYPPYSNLKVCLADDDDESLDIDRAGQTGARG